MSETPTIPLEEVLPSPAAILTQQGVLGEPGEALLAIAEDGLEELTAVLRLKSIVTPIEKQRFATVYSGAGSNDLRSPLAEIYPQAEALYLFATTCGAEVSARIGAAFAVNDYPLAMAIDAAASLTADAAAAWIETRAGRAHPGMAPLRYSPGYCGWHVSGQQALFDVLEPERIGLKLTPSSLMEPLKSVSGVIVIGPAAIHRFEIDYPFCQACTTRDCRARINDLNAN